MHPNPIFRNEDVARSLDFAKAAGIGHLIMNGERTPLAAHIPFHLSDDYKSVELHLVRSKLIAYEITDGAAPVKLMTPEVMEKMMQQIVSCEFSIEEVQSNWKLIKTNPKPSAQCCRSSRKI